LNYPWFIRVEHSDGLTEDTQLSYWDNINRFHENRIGLFIEACVVAFSLEEKKCGEEFVGNNSFTMLERKMTALNSLGFMCSCFQSFKACVVCLKRGVLPLLGLIIFNKGWPH